ncbi:MAG: thiamine phosphate synthase [Anaerolineae bacterium]
MKEIDRSKARLTGVRVHLITNRHLVQGPLERAIQAALEGGVHAVHLREPDFPAGALYTLAKGLRDITRGHALLIVNDRLDVALAVGADGVQLPGRGLPVAVARSLGGKDFLIGRSVHSVEEALQAEADGADYLLLGTIYATRSHPEIIPCGPTLVAEVCQAVDIPLYAIGGIEAHNAAVVMRAGAAGIAVISAILGASDIKEATRRLVQAVEGFER